MANFTHINGKSFYLQPVNGRKSFYNKAVVVLDNDGNYWLKSYETIIAMYDHNKNLHRLWGGWSLTSGAHFAAFCDWVDEMNWSEATKSFWNSLEVEDISDLYIPD